MLSTDDARDPTVSMRSKPGVDSAREVGRLVESSSAAGALRRVKGILIGITLSCRLYHSGPKWLKRTLKERVSYEPAVCQQDYLGATAAL